jgi:type II secretory pathway component PulF
MVVPTLITALVEAERSLPWPTRVLQRASDLLLMHGWWVCLVIIGVLTIVVMILRAAEPRRICHRWLLRIPIVGPLALKQSIARIALVMATLMRSGIVYLSALEIAARSTRNLAVQQALEESGSAVRAGKDIGQALARSGLFPPLVIQVFAVGQQSGRLDEMLPRLSADYERQVRGGAARLVSLLEPVLIVVLAVFVGFILFATLLPILEAGNVL